MDKKLANILLLSDKDFDYQTLVDAGYKNVFWFKSLLRANEYFKGREEELEKFDIMLMGSSSLRDADYYKYQYPFYSAINRENPVTCMCFFSSQFEEEEEKKRFYVFHPHITSDGVSKDDFLSVLNDSIPDELKCEVIEIPSVEEKEVVLPKKRADVKVLFMGYLVNQDLVKKIFNDAGFNNCDFIRSNNFTLRDNVENLADYDLVVVDSGFNGSLSLLGDEFQDYMKDKGKAIYFVVYNYDYRKKHLNRYYVQGLPTDHPQDKVFIEFYSIEKEENSLKDIMGIVINVYTSYNKNIGAGGYLNKEELEEKYHQQFAEFVEETKVIDHNMHMIGYIKTMLEKYRKFYNSGHFLWYMENALKGLKVDILENGVSGAFLVGNREALRITYKDDENFNNADYYLNFYLEYLNQKGNKMCSPVKRTCNSSYCEDKSSNYPSDEELKKIEALYNRVKKELEQMIEDLENVYRNAKNCSASNKNKSYNKRYV